MCVILHFLDNKSQALVTVVTDALYIKNHVCSCQCYNYVILKCTGISNHLFTVIEVDR